MVWWFENGLDMLFCCGWVFLFFSFLGLLDVVCDLEFGRDPGLESLGGMLVGLSYG